MVNIILIELNTLYIERLIFQIPHIKNNIFNLLHLQYHIRIIIYSNKELLN